MLNLLCAGHRLFGTKHLVIVAACAVLIVLGAIFSRKLRFATVCKTMLIIGICSEIVKIFYYILANEPSYGGILPKTDLPFHLCSIQILFTVYINFTKNQAIKRKILSFMLPSCLVGGIAAILIATDSSRNGSWVITAQYFIYHVALVIFSLHMYLSKELAFTVRDYFGCLQVLLVIMFFAFYINSMLYVPGGKEMNFMYVSSPPQPGLPFLTEKYGWGVYITHYACLVILAVTACYCVPIAKAIKQKFGADTDKSADLDKAA